MKLISNNKIRAKDNIYIHFNQYINNHNEVVIISPGWCMTKGSKSFKRISEYFSKHFDVITIDYRGHGKSGGFFTFGTKEIDDLEVLVNHAKEIGYKKIFLIGFSLGASTSLIVASRLDYINGVIAVSPPADFDKIENHMWKKAAWLETLKKFELSRFLSIRPSLINHNKIKAIDIIDKVNVPTLFIAGGMDPTVYAWHTEELYKKAICKKEYKLYKDGYHAEDLFLHFEDDFTITCKNWLETN